MTRFGVGTNRATFAIKPFVFKIARHKRGARCNLYEAKLYAEARPLRKTMLCPIVWCSANGAVLLARYAKPLTELECKHLRETDGFPDWDYQPGEDPCPFEYKSDDWGWLSGKLLAIDYSVDID